MGNELDIPSKNLLSSFNAGPGWVLSNWRSVKIMSNSLNLRVCLTGRSVHHTAIHLVFK